MRAGISRAMLAGTVEADVPGYGWGFVLADKVNAVSGRWSFAGDDPSEYRHEFRCGENVG